MRAVIQRVTRASCTVEKQKSGSIEQGFVILIGIEQEDEHADVEWLCQKIVKLRIFSDQEGLMNKSIQDIQGNILLISQFTLFAATKKGNRPSFVRAARPEKAKPLYLSMAARLSSLLNKEVQMGVFGADMKIDLVNDGPVTLMMDTKDKDNF